MKKNSLLTLSLIFLVVFILIALNINSAAIKSLDNSINLFSAAHQSPFLQNSSIFLSTIFEPIYVIIFVLALSIVLWFVQKRKHSIILFSTSLLGGAFIYVLKHLFERARPVNQIITDSGFSFPSGHALISAVLFGVLIYYSIGIKSQTKKIISIVACIFGILAVGLSRVYLNVHWFSDVVAGYCLGLFLVLGVLYLYRTFSK